MTNPMMQTQLPSQPPSAAVAPKTTEVMVVLTAKQGISREQIKASITGDEPADVEEYRREKIEFPQQSTVDQFFSESQFESYRRLGLHEARTVLDHFNGGLPLDDSFARLSARWELPPPAPEGHLHAMPRRIQN
jgi:hypothetical protein